MKIKNVISLAAILTCLLITGYIRPTKAQVPLIGRLNYCTIGLTLGSSLFPAIARFPDLPTVRMAASRMQVCTINGFASYFLGVGQPPKTPPLPGVKNPIAKLPPPTRRERRNSGKAQTNGTIPSNNPSENVLQIDDYPAFFQQVGAKLADQSFQNILIQQFRQEIKTLEGSEFERLKQMVNEVEVMQADSSKNNAPVMKA